MPTQDFVEISPDALRRLREQKAEGEYALVDVRQPEEYQAGHIPGAMLFPLGELEESMDLIPENKDVVFYCAAGARSAMAARLAAASGRFQGRLFSLQGGFGSWEGLSLPDFPKVELFAADDSLQDMLLRAMEQEKAAMRLYKDIHQKALDADSSRIICSLMQELASFEEAHARAVYTHLQRHWQGPGELPAFEPLFESMQGAILEGGRDMGEVQPWIEDALNNAASRCMEVAELALELEMSALDLYDVLAARMQDPEAKKVFLSLAQQEKSHARLIMKHLEDFARPLQQDAREA